MNKLFILLFLVLCSTAFSQVMVSKPNLWSKGDIIVGVNSDLTGVSWTDISLTPSVGYALSDKDLVYANFSYVDAPQRSAYRLGYNRAVCSTAYVGIAGSISKFQTDNLTKYLCLEVGIGRNLTDWLLITPKIAFGHLWDSGITQYTVNSTVTFGIKL